MAKSSWRNDPENHLKYRVQNFYSSLRRTGKAVPERVELIQKLQSIIGTPCIYCESELTTTNVSLDHKMPTSRNGDNSLENIDFICQKCNRLKGAFTNTEFRELLRWLSAPKRAELKRILIKRLGMSNYRFGKRG